MTQVLTPGLATILSRPQRPVPPTVEDGLHIGASTLCHASADLITSTTIVVDIGLDDLDALRRVVSHIAESRELDAEIQPHVGWCSVRFSRPRPDSG
ncbi:MAG: hypothetical protein JOZ87_12940 [Chloroflexi bacterium]|nr:hypothetical protein [Chloroflexota bacterium]